MKAFYPLLLVATLGSSLIVNATEPPKGEILVPVMQQGDHSTKMPKHGDSKQTVLEAFGEPLKKVPAVGVPPISRWDYEKFSVYFENNITLHAVLKH